MIEKATSYKTSDGAVHATIEEAKTAEFHMQLADQIPDLTQAAANLAKRITDAIICNGEMFASILKIKARKPRTPKTGRPKGSKNKSTLLGTKVGLTGDEVGK